MSSDESLKHETAAPNESMNTKSTPSITLTMKSYPNRTTMRKKKSTAAALLLGLGLGLSSIPLSNALDVEVTAVKCDDLPVTADIKVRCTGRDGSGSSSRCTFGESATISGTCKF